MAIPPCAAYTVSSQSCVDLCTQTHYVEQQPQDSRQDNQRLLRHECQFRQLYQTVRTKDQVQLYHISQTPPNLGPKHTSTKFLFLLLRTGHLKFRAKSLNALIKFKPSAILIAVVIALYILFLPSPSTPLSIHAIVAHIYAPHNATVIRNRNELPMRICRSCLPVWSSYGI